LIPKLTGFSLKGNSPFGASESMATTMGGVSSALKLAALKPKGGDDTPKKIGIPKLSGFSTKGESNGVADPDPSIEAKKEEDFFYLEERENRKLYFDEEVHSTLLMLIFSLLMTPRFLSLIVFLLFFF
jgi:hypothetical protein